MNPSTTTLISFIGTGRKRDPKDSRSGYQKTTYEFKLDGDKPLRLDASFFGIALLHALRARGQNVARWVVLGTNASLWPELVGLVENDDPLTEQYYSLDQKVADRTVSESALQDWQEVINASQRIVEVRCCLVDEALTSDGQSLIARHLLQQVPCDSDVVFDVSHGFRHQPIIATHVVSLMRWTHSIRSVRFFSGVLEASRDGVAPVVELPICQQLAETTEAAATLELTGNYEPLARQIGLDGGRAWFLENTNQLHRALEPIQGLRKALADSSRCNTDPIDTEAAKLFLKSLSWVDGASFASRYQDAARHAVAHHDFARWAVLAFESIVVLAVERFYVDGDPLDHDHRESAAKKLSSQLSPRDKHTWRLLKQVRNTCAHGSRPRVATAQAVLSDARAFRELLAAAAALFDRLSSSLHPCRISITSAVPAKKPKTPQARKGKHRKPR